MPDIRIFEEMPGVGVANLDIRPDERGFFTEAIRSDWKDLLGEDTIVQSNVSFSYPGIIRAWHRHRRGQNDYFMALQGAVKICAYDENEDVARSKLVSVTAGASRLQIVRIPGHYWHGFKVVSDTPALIVYFTTRLYDPRNPDEERRPWDSVTAIDRSTGQPFDWNRAPHK